MSDAMDNSFINIFHFHTFDHAHSRVPNSNKIFSCSPTKIRTTMSADLKLQLNNLVDGVHGVMEKETRDCFFISLNEIE